ncbi:MAG: hypothetical protein HQL99_17015 [Magnetococcales bacterium]|nr:hypothetical protein [Magnetococcales bacterium]
MMAVELDATILNRRIEVASDRLPLHSVNARVIVLFEESRTPLDTVTHVTNRPLAELLATSYSPVGDGLPMRRTEIYDRACLR